jgi:hypothetical protein
VVSAGPKEDGSFWLDQRYFNYATGLTMTSRKFVLKLTADQLKAIEKRLKLLLGQENQKKVGIS